MTAREKTVSSRIVIWSGASVESCSVEDQGWLAGMLSITDTPSLRSLHGLNSADIGELADRFEKILERADLGRVVHAWRPFTAALNSSADPARDPYGQSVDTLELSVRSSNCLENTGVRTVGELARLTTDDLFRIKNMGRKSVTEIQESLAAFRRNIGLQPETGVPPSLNPAGPAHAFCTATLLPIDRCGLTENMVDRLRSAGIHRLDDLVVRTRKALRYLSGLDESEIEELEVDLERLGLFLDASLPTWLRAHFTDVADAFEGEIACLSSEATGTISSEQGHPSLGSPLPYHVESAYCDQSQGPRCLEDETEAFFTRDAKPRDKELVRRLLGWDGGQATTLDQVGREFDLSRERVRQILLRSLRRQGIPSSALLTKAIELISLRVPALAEEAEQALMESGITRGRFRTEAIEETAREFDLPIDWRTILLNSRRIVVTEFARSRMQEFLTAARKRVSHYGTTRREYVLADLRYEPTVQETNCFWLILEGVVWLDDQGNWFWMPTGRNAVLNRLANILRVAPRIDIEIARQGVLRDRRMEGAELPLDVFRALCTTLPWCSVDREELVATPSSDEAPAGEQESDEQILAEVLRQHGPVMTRRELYRIARARGVEKVAFYRLISGSNVLVNHGADWYGLIGSTFSAPSVEELIEDEGHEEQEDDTPEPSPAPSLAQTEAPPSQTGYFDDCDPGCATFHEQVLRCVNIRSALLRSAGPWSLMELGLGASDFQALRSWSNFGCLEPGWSSARMLRSSATSFSGIEALALTFLLSCCEIARNSSSEGELWPKVEAEIGAGLRTELFAAPATPKLRIREATESVCSKLGIRHVFGREGEQSWLRSVFLQFGITRSGWRKLPLWLSGRMKPPAAIEALLGSGACHSASFVELWQTLQRLNWKHITEQQARATLARGPWVTTDEIEVIVAAAAERADDLQHRGADKNPSAEPDPLIGAPRLAWRDEPRFELPFDGRSSWLVAPRYVLVVGQRRIPIACIGEGYALDTPGGRLEVDLRDTAVTVDLHLRQASCLTEPLLIQLAPDEFDFVFYNSSGHALPNGEEKFVPPSGCVLLCRSNCEVTVEPPEAYVRRVFHGEWTVRCYRDSVPSQLEIRKNGVVIWSGSRATEPAAAPSRQKPRVECAGGNWGELATVHVHSPGDVDPKYLVVGETRVRLEAVANGGYRGRITLSPGVDYRSAVTRIEYEWNGRLRRRGADLVMGPLAGVAVEGEQGWKVFRAGTDVDAEYLRAHKLLIRTASHYDGEPVAAGDWALMEGDHFCGRPRNTSGGAAIGGSLHGVGQSLHLCVGPYNRPLRSPELARSVINTGVVQRVERDGDTCHIQLRGELQLGDNHALWLWYEGRNEPNTVPAGDWIQEDNQCLIGLGTNALPIAVAVSFHGAWLGGRTCRPGWDRFADLIRISSDWESTARWLRWWRVPLLRESLTDVTRRRALEVPIATILAWTSSTGLPEGVNFSEENEGAWRSVIRNHFWEWRPGTGESASILSTLGLLTGSVESDIERAWDGFDALLAINPLLLVQAASRGLAALFVGQEQEDWAYWIEKLRNRILGFDGFVLADQVDKGLRNALRKAAESMAVDEFFVSRSLLPDAINHIAGAPVNDHNLRVAIANSQAARSYLAAATLQEILRGGLR